jgi:hypothetical protein
MNHHLIHTIACYFEKDKDFRRFCIAMNDFLPKKDRYYRKLYDSLIHTNRFCSIFENQIFWWKMPKTTKFRALEVYLNEYHQNDDLLDIIKFLSCSLEYGKRIGRPINMNIITGELSNLYLFDNTKNYKKKCYVRYSVKNYNYLSYSDEDGHTMKHHDNEISDIKLMCKPLNKPVELYFNWIYGLPTDIVSDMKKTKNRTLLALLG